MAQRVSETGATSTTKLKRRGNLESRTKAKNANFNLIFGGGQSGAARAGIDLSQADIHAWRGVWQESAAAIDSARRLADSGDEDSAIVIDGAYGYQRTLEGDSLTASNILNTPVQSTAALGLKAAMVELDRRGQADNLLMVLHDEIVLGPFTDKADAENAERELRASLIAGVSAALKSLSPPNSVPIEVESSVGRGWAKDGGETANNDPDYSDEYWVATSRPPPLGGYPAKNRGLPNVYSRRRFRRRKSGVARVDGGVLQPPLQERPDLEKGG